MGPCMSVDATGPSARNWGSEGPQTAPTGTLSHQRRSTNGNSRARQQNPFSSIDVPDRAPRGSVPRPSPVPTRPALILPDEQEFTPSCNGRNGYTVEDVYPRSTKELGSGTFGSVYQGRHVQSSGSRKIWHNVAVKKTSPTILDKREGKLYDYSDIEQNCQEIKTLLRLREKDPQHAVVLHLYEFFWKYSTDGKGELVLVSELLGEELDKWRQRQAQFYESSARKISATLMDALDFMHQRGVVHRDLKLQNVLFSRENDFSSLKIVDFGLAKVLDNGRKAKDFCGSLGYIAPEMYKNQEYGLEVDMFAMGVIVFRLLSGVRPFASSNQDKLRHDTINLRYTIEGRSWDGVSSEAIQLVRKLLIGRDERIEASAAVDHEWFRTHEESILRVDFTQGDDFNPNDSYSKAVVQSHAPSQPSSAKNEHRFILELALDHAVNLLLSEGLYSARIDYNGDGDRNSTGQSDGLFCVEEFIPPQSLVLPRYVARRTTYTEKNCRRICRNVANIIKVSHDSGMAHRNIHVNNFLFNVSTKKVMVRGLQYAQAVEEGRALTGHFGYLYSWYAFKAPEIDSALYHDKSVDMWSLGALIYMLLTGLPPFRGDGADLITNKHNGNVSFDMFILSESSKRLIKSLLQVNPAERLTIDEVLDSEWMIEADEVLDQYDLSLCLDIMRDFEHRPSTSSS